SGRRPVRAWMPHGSAPGSSLASWVYQAWLARKNAPSPRWTMRTGADSGMRGTLLEVGEVVGGPLGQREVGGEVLAHHPAVVAGLDELSEVGPQIGLPAAQRSGLAAVADGAVVADTGGLEDGVLHVHVGQVRAEHLRAPQWAL